MTKREIANLCCRVLAIYALLQGLPIVSGTLSMLIRLGRQGSSGLATFLNNYYLIDMLVWATYPGVMLIAAVVLWRKSGVIAAWMVGHDLQDDQHEPETIRQRPTIAEIHAIAISIVGLWLVTDAVPGTLVELGGMLMSRSWGLDESGFVYSSRSIFEHLLRLIIGLWLIFSAPGLVRLLRRRATSAWRNASGPASRSAMISRRRRMRPADNGHVALPCPA